MSFTTIINGEGDAMRQLESKSSAKKTPAKKTTTTRKAPQAQLVLANGDMGAAGRIGFSLVSAGLTGFTIGLVEGLSRKGRVKWWGKLAPHKRGMILLAFATVAGLIARHRRKGGHPKSALALEAAALGAWTMAIAYFTEAAVGGTQGQLGELAKRGVGDLGIDELKAIDSQIDDDIQSAAQRLRRMAEEERTAAEVEHDEHEDDDLGALAYEGEPIYDDEDDDIIY